MLCLCVCRGSRSSGRWVEVRRGGGSCLSRVGVGGGKGGGKLPIEVGEGRGGRQGAKVGAGRVGGTCDATRGPAGGQERVKPATTSTTATRLPTTPLAHPPSAPPVD